MNFVVFLLIFSKIKLRTNLFFYTFVGDTLSFQESVVDFRLMVNFKQFQYIKIE